MELREIRCTCGQLAAKAAGTAVLEIRCTRCKHLVHARLEAGALVEIKVTGVGSNRRRVA